MGRRGSLRLWATAVGCALGATAIVTLAARPQRPSAQPLVPGDIATIVDPVSLGAPAQRLGQVSFGKSLRFYGTGSGGIDRVVVPLHGGTAVNVGATDFTVEFWLKGALAANTATGCSAANDAWINGNIVIDRDVYGGGDHGDYGIALLGGKVVFGSSAGGAGATVCGNAMVLDGAWHHVAATRRASDGRLQVWVDGVLDAQVASSPAAGNVSYRVGRSTAYPADPTLVFGAEKHDAGAAYPSFTGWLDEVRVSTRLRYSAAFTRPVRPFVVDADTAALYHFDAGAGTVVADTVGTSPGTRQVGGPANGPQWSSDVPG
jgi:hypothetical protein